MNKSCLVGLIQCSCDADRYAKECPELPGPADPAAQHVATRIGKPECGDSSIFDECSRTRGPALVQEAALRILPLQAPDRIDRHVA